MMLTTSETKAATRPRKASQKDLPRKMVTVHSTTNYDRFSTILMNRPVNNGHVLSIMESMKNEVLYAPIIVNEKGQVIDGQHRLEACRRLETPVDYIVMQGYGHKEVMAYNQSLKQWSIPDFVNAYAKLGNNTYSTVIKISQSAGISIPMCIALFGRAKKSGDAARVTKAVKNGTLALTHNITDAVELVSKISDIAKFWTMGERSPVSAKGFCQSSLTLIQHPNYDHERMIHKLSIYNGKDLHYNTGQEFRVKMEDVFNYRSKDKVSIRY